MTHRHRCRVCGKTSFESDEFDDMVKISIRHWKHFGCLQLFEIDALSPGDERRFNEWWKWKKIFGPAD
jgi:hypothetical protein